MLSEFAASTALEKSLLHEAYRRLPIGVAANFALGLIVWGVLQFMDGHGIEASLWLGSIAAVDLFDFAGYRAYRIHIRKAAIADVSHARWYWQYVTQSLLTGLVWGLGSVAVLYPLDTVEPMRATFIGMVITGLATSVPAVICPHRYGSLIMISGMMLPLSAFMIASGVPSYQLIGVAMAGGWILQCVLSHLMHSALRAQFHSEERLKVALVEAKNARILAEQSAQSKTLFFANMSHELRTPVHAMFGMQRLLETTTLSDKQQSYVHNTIQAGQILLGLIDDVLDLASMDTGKFQITPSPFSLTDMLARLQTVLLVAVGNKPLKLILNTESTMPKFLIGDERRISQILLNLGSNAIKFSSKGQVRIDIELGARQGDSVSVVFRVRDEGIGIDPQRQASIFDDFVQENASTAKKYGGHGLGLAISKRLVAQMGGEITLQSTPGIGSVFLVTLPLEVLDDSDAPALTNLLTSKALPTKNARLPGMRILIVDDDALNREIAQSLLENEGAEVAVADAGRKCIALVLANPDYFDAILMDLRMPHMDGYETTRQLRMRYSKDELPIFAVSANAMRSDVNASADAGMNQHISKPFAIDDLVNRLRDYRRLR